MGKAERSILAEFKQVTDWENSRLRLSPATRLCCQTRTAVNGQLQKPKQKYKCLSKLTANHHDQEGRLCYKGMVWLRVRSQAGLKDSTSRQWSNSHGFQANQFDAQITRVIILADSIDLLQKVESGMGCPCLNTTMRSL